MTGLAVAPETALRHVLKSQQFSRETLEQLFRRAQEIQIQFKDPEGRANLRTLLKGKTAINLLYEPSTRTRMSFEFAEQYLGMQWHSTENAKDFSSAAKGEVLQDSIRTLSRYHPDVLVMRHYQTGAAEIASAYSSAPVINAGDGKGQHPTQSLLDLFTIQQRLGSIDGKKVIIGGDLKHGRTARSLAYLLSKFSDVTLMFVSPQRFAIGQDIKDHLEKPEIRARGIRYWEFESVDPVLSLADVLYWTRVQKERMPWWLKFSYRFVAPHYRITQARAQCMPEHAIILHPLPRVDEISPEVDSNKRAAYFDQVENGMFVRMALLLWVMQAS